MQALAVSAGHGQDAFIPYDAKQVSDAVMKHGAAVALAEVTFDRRTQIGIAIAVDEIRRFAAD